MKKITVDEARKLLKRGIFPKCEVERDLIKPVKSFRELDNLLKLSSFQKCQFYGYEKKDLRKFKIPNEALELSIDEATHTILSKEPVFVRLIEGDEKSFSDINSFVSFLKQCEINGDNFLIFWRA